MQSSGQNIRSAREVLEREQGVAYFASLIETIAEHKSRDAFAELFKHFAPRLKGYLMRLGSSDPQAEEIAQEAMLTVWRKAHLYKRDLAAPRHGFSSSPVTGGLICCAACAFLKLILMIRRLSAMNPRALMRELIGRVEADKVRGALQAAGRTARINSACVLQRLVTFGNRPRDRITAGHGQIPAATGNIAPAQRA